MKNPESKNPKVVKTKNGKIIFLSKCVVCNGKKSKFIKEQQARWLLINLMGIEGPILSDLPIINTLFSKYTMNTIVNKSLLARDKFIPGMHLKQPGFTYSAIGPFTKNK